MATLGDLANLVRSKNAGPFWLTIDLMFDDAEAYRRARDAEIVNRATIARLYNQPPVPAAARIAGHRKHRCRAWSPSFGDGGSSL